MNDWFSVVEFYRQKYVKCLLTFNLLGKINVHVYLCKHVISKCYTSDSFQYYNINIYFTYFSAMYSLGLFWTIGLAKILSRAKKLEMSVTFKDGFQNLSLNEWHTLVGIVIVAALKWVTHLNVSHVSHYIFWKLALLKTFIFLSNGKPAAQKTFSSHGFFHFLLQERRPLFAKLLHFNESSSLFVNFHRHKFSLLF